MSEKWFDWFAHAMMLLAAVITLAGPPAFLFAYLIVAMACGR